MPADHKEDRREAKVRAGDLVESIIEVASMTDAEMMEYLRQGGITDAELSEGARRLYERIKQAALEEADGGPTRPDSES